MTKRCDNCVAKYVYKTEKGFNNHVKLYHMCSNDSEAVGSISSDSLTFVPKSCEYCNSKYIYKKLNGYNKHILTKHSNQISSKTINSNSQILKEFNFSEDLNNHPEFIPSSDEVNLLNLDKIWSDDWLNDLKSFGKSRSNSFSFCHLNINSIHNK